MLRKAKFWSVYVLGIALVGLYWLGEREQEGLDRILTSVDDWLGSHKP